MAQVIFNGITYDLTNEQTEGVRAQVVVAAKANAVYEFIVGIEGQQQHRCLWSKGVPITFVLDTAQDLDTSP